MTQALHITLAQINPTVGDIRANADLIRKTWREAPEAVDLILLPELVLCGYPPEDLILKPFFLKLLDEEVRKLVEESAGRKSALFLPAPFRIDGLTYNVGHLIHDGRILGTVVKHHLPNYGVFDEQRVFHAGPLPEPLEFKGHKLGFMICEDMWFEDCARNLKDHGASMLIVVNASPFEVDKLEHRQDLARRRVSETGLPLIYLNQWGGQDELVFDGASFVMSAGGDILMQANSFADDICSTLWEKRNGGPWLCGAGPLPERKDRLDSLYTALVTGLRDYVGKNGFNGVLIGLSGGIDSAISAAIAVDALGPDLVHCVMMPSRFTSKESLEDAAEQARNLGIVCDMIPIEQPVETFNELLARHLPPNPPAITFENIQSRSRGLILMALSNATGRMVLSTGNKSEMAVGYATLYGDMCGGFNALKDVYKTEVFALARYRNAHRPGHCLGPKGAIIPERIITKPPSAELKPDQTDQDSLPPYDVLDDILFCLIEQDLSISDIVAKGHDRAVVARVWRLLDSAEYKRRQSPPGVKITARAFGRERRYPITNGFRKVWDE
jgi:NAD+ synthase